MSKTIRKTSFCLAFLMAFMMVFSLLPLNVNAQESIEIKQADLDAVKNDTQSHIDTAKGIEYFDESGIFNLYKPAEYVLTGDIALNAECLDISSEDGPTVLDLNGHTISCIHGISEEISGETIYYGAVVCGRNPLTVKDSKGSGMITVDNDTEYAIHAFEEITVLSGKFDGQIAFERPATIKGGLFLDNVTAFDSIVIEAGVFGDANSVEGFDLILNDNSVINGGVFNKYVHVNGFTTINNGNFRLIRVLDEEANLIINGGHFGNTLSIEYGYCEIEDGIFEYDGAGNSEAIDLTDARLVINGGSFFNKDDSSINTMHHVVRAYGSDNPEDFTSLTINAGTFGVSTGYAIMADNVDYLKISGGEFTGKSGGLLVNDLGNSEISLEGGKFTGLGAAGEEYTAAIATMSVRYATYYEIEYKDHYFDDYLADGYEFVSAAETNKKMNGDELIALYTQSELMVLPKEADVVFDEENADLNQQVNALINKLKAGESVEGISPELAEMILDAIAEGKDISVEMSVTPINPEDVKEDSEKVTALVGNDGKVAAYFDVNIAIIIEGETVGFITKLDDGVLIKLPIPEGLPDPESGLLREWKIVRVHNGIASELSAEAGDGYVSGKSAEFSTYALVYNDAATPATGDFGITPWLIIITAAAASSLIVVSVRKFKNE